MNENLFRTELAKTLKQTPKAGRQEYLAHQKTTPEYWQARVDKLGQDAEWSDDRTSLSWDKKSVFHGTTADSIESFDYADESTVGTQAIYFTVDPELAMGYAKLRSQERSGDPHLYKVSLSDVKMQNWAQQPSVDQLKLQLKGHIMGIQQELENGDYDLFAEKYGIKVKQAIVERSLDRMNQQIDEEGSLTGGNVKTIAQGIPGVFFQDFVEQSGFDGVITIEAGDDPEHTAKPGLLVVLFDKDKIEHQLANPLEFTPNVTMPELRSELLQMKHIDQDIRKKIEQSLGEQGTPYQGVTPFGEDMRRIDLENTERLKEIVEAIGYPSIEEVGLEGAIAMWVLVQHADHDVEFQELCLEQLQKHAENGQARMQDVAYLTDRVRRNKGEPQVFGTQFWLNQKTGNFEPQPIEDPEKVDKLRKQYRMETLQENINRMK